MAPLSGSKAGEGKTTIARRGFGSLFASLDSGGESDFICANPSISNWEVSCRLSLHWRGIGNEIQKVVTRRGFTVQLAVTKHGGFLPEQKDNSEEKLRPGHMILGIFLVRVKTEPQVVFSVYGVQYTVLRFHWSKTQRIYSKVLPLCIK